MELLIDENIRRHRKAHNMTQEQLAQALGISPQSISKWETGDRYPDITLLPRIANYFRITVDELIGNDEIGRKADIGKFREISRQLTGRPTEELARCRTFYRKYPDNFAVMNCIGWVITAYNLKDELPLLREVSQKVIDRCTDQHYRHQAAEHMCAFCEDGELERWLSLYAPSYDAYRVEMLEERL